MSFVCDQKEYTPIPLSDLMFDERVADMIEKCGKVFPVSLINNIYDAGTFHLDQHRLTHILDGYDIGLPPISVKKTLGGKYEVLNGRHRVCATIIKGGSTVASLVHE